MRRPALAAREQPFRRGPVIADRQPGGRTRPREGALPLRDSAGISPDFAVLHACPGVRPRHATRYAVGRNASRLIR
jgi:hypothetical protein